MGLTLNPNPQKDGGSQRHLTAAVIHQRGAVAFKSAAFVPIRTTVNVQRKTDPSHSLQA